MNQTRLNNTISTDEDDPKVIRRLSKEERETYYRIDDVDNMWIADAAIPKDIHKLERQGWILIDTQYYKDGEVMSKRFKAPRKCLSPRSYNPDKPKSDKPKRIVSEEQKQKMAEGRKAKKALKANENN
jgi:hypothetical protein